MRKQSQMPDWVYVPGEGDEPIVEWCCRHVSRGDAGKDHPRQCRRSAQRGFKVKVCGQTLYVCWQHYDAIERYTTPPLRYQS